WGFQRYDVLSTDYPTFRILFSCSITTNHPIFRIYIGATKVLTMSTVFKILKATGTVAGAAAAKFIIWLAGKLERGK
ncbi:hypothetical protein, partial [uncultured Acetatifactor sp.]|uniref:hypothetical protein n=1 Tax=uncultured Acetatifactor sp. TaxID=1671927 RepID=UPI00262B834F